MPFERLMQCNRMLLLLKRFLKNLNQKISLISVLFFRCCCCYVRSAMVRCISNFMHIQFESSIYQWILCGFLSLSLCLFWKNFKQKPYMQYGFYCHIPNIDGFILYANFFVLSLHCKLKIETETKNRYISMYAHAQHVRHGR